MCGSHKRAEKMWTSRHRGKDNKLFGGENEDQPEAVRKWFAGESQPKQPTGESWLVP